MGQADILSFLLLKIMGYKVVK
ncbi:hypothetical protein BDCR2A_00040 [Borrelia duttonii CR2A]|uniref:Uncharacterized protein n=1 Tax=Borrelia duttonii CR2A TaxID=1432657 RepID=W6TGN0_9SPIR|nr:hypothetical protein BDCR2A_00040 [Borrelia duttonii CR2A]